MPCCVVNGCTSNKSKNNNLEGTILHVFPPNIDRIKIWLRQTGQDFGDLDAFAEKVLVAKKHDTYRLCSAHFTPQCYMDCNVKKVLRRDALPTIFNKNIENGQRKYRRGVYKTRNASTQTNSGLGTQTIKSSSWKERSHVVIDPHRIDEIRGKFTKIVLDLAMEIICLLTREDNTVGKKSSDGHVKPDTHPHILKSRTTTESPNMETPPPSLTPETNYKEILEVTNKINELLMGEVPITLQDVIVYFSMEESQYIEGSKDIITEDQQNQGDSSVFEVEVEVNDEQEKSFVKIDEARMDMDISPEITYPEDTKTTQCDIDVKKEEEKHVRIKEEEVAKEISTGSEDFRDIHRAIKVEKEEEGHVWIKKEEIAPEISIGKNCDNMKMNSISPYDSGTDDDITDNSSDECPATPKSNPARHSERLSCDPPKHKKRVSKHSSPISHHTNGKESEEVQSSENGKAPYVCFLCEETFSDKSTLRRHEWTHRTEKRYYCQECGKNYLYKSLFISHRRIHTGEKPYLCSLCGKSFTKKHSLVRHLGTHNGKK